MKNQDGSIEKLYELISHGNKRIGEQRKEKAILIMGETGAGKSTLALLFAGKALRAVNKAGSLVIEETNPLTEGAEDGDVVKISHKKVSQTKIPSQVTSESGLVVWDCPGFGDLGRDPIQDIANAFYIQRLFETSKELKFVLAVSWYDMQGRSGQLLKIVDHFVKLFKDIKEISRSVSLVATQVPPHVTTENIKEIIQAVLADNQSIEIRSRQMLGYLSVSIAIFYTPTAAGVLEKMVGSIQSASGASTKENPILSCIEENTAYLKTNPGAANVVISKGSEDLANALFNGSNTELLKLLKDVAQKILQICQRINSKGNEIKEQEGMLESAWNFMGRVFTGDEKQKYKTSSYKELLNLNSILTFEAFCNFMTERQNNIQIWLMSVDEKVTSVTGALKQYNNDIPLIEAQIKEKIKYVQFLSKVWSGQSLEQRNYISVFQECTRAVSQAAQKGVESLDVKKNESCVEYYQAAIKFLDRYPQITACLEKKRSAVYEVGKIYHNKKQYDLAVKAYVDAIRLEAEIARQNPPTQQNRYNAQPQSMFVASMMQSQGIYGVNQDVSNRNNNYNQPIPQHLAQGMDNPYRKLDHIYLVTKNIKIDATIAKQLLEFNLQVLKKLLETKLTKYINDFMNNQRYFDRFAHEDETYMELDDLDNLKSLYSALQNISSSVSRLKLSLTAISDTLKKDFNISPDKTERNSTVCESVYEFDEEDPLEIILLHAEIDYVEFLQTASLSRSNSFEQLSSLFDSKKANDALLKKIKATELDPNEKPEYYNRIIAHAAQYPTDQDSVRLTAHANLVLAKKQEKDNDKISFYRKAITQNDQLLVLCRNSDTQYYARHSIKREACETLGDIYFGLSRFQEAADQFKLIDSHIKIKACYTKLLESNKNSHSVREQYADYLGTKGMVDTALDYYHEALSLTSDSQNHVRINKKISEVIAAQNGKSKDYATRAKHIESTSIVFAATNIVYENPIMAIIHDLKFTPLELNKLLTMTDSMVKNGQRNLVEKLMNTHQAEALLTQVELYYTISTIPYTDQVLPLYQAKIGQGINKQIVSPMTGPKASLFKFNR